MLGKVPVTVNAEAVFLADGVGAQHIGFKGLRVPGNLIQPVGNIVNRAIGRVCLQAVTFNHNSQLFLGFKEGGFGDLNAFVTHIHHAGTGLLQIFCGFHGIVQGVHM